MKELIRLNDYIINTKYIYNIEINYKGKFLNLISLEEETVIYYETKKQLNNDINKLIKRTNFVQIESNIINLDMVLNLNPYYEEENEYIHVYFGPYYFFNILLPRKDSEDIINDIELRLKD